MAPLCAARGWQIDALDSFLHLAACHMISSDHLFFHGEKMVNFSFRFSPDKQSINTCDRRFCWDLFEMFQQKAVEYFIPFIIFIIVANECSVFNSTFLGNSEFFFRDLEKQLQFIFQRLPKMSLMLRRPFCDQTVMSVGVVIQIHNAGVGVAGPNFYWVFITFMGESLC
jgi:hypothetical protein